MQLILLWFKFINDLYMFRTFICPSSGVLMCCITAACGVMPCEKTWLGVSGFMILYCAAHKWHIPDWTQCSRRIWQICAAFLNQISSFWSPDLWCLQSVWISWKQGWEYSVWRTTERTKHWSTRNTSQKLPRAGMWRYANCVCVYIQGCW